MDNFIGQIVAAAVGILPLFIVPSLLKKSVDAVPAIGQLANKWSNRASSSMSKNGKEAYKQTDFARANTIRKTEIEKRRNAGFARRVNEGSVLAKLGAGKRGSEVLTRTARSKVAQTEAEEMKNAQSSIEYEMNAEREKVIGDGGEFNEKKWIAGYIDDPSKSESDKSAAIHMAAAKGFDGILRNVRDNPETTPAHKVALSRAISANAGSLNSKAPDLVKGPSAAFESISAEELVGYSEGTMEEYVKHIHNLSGQAQVDAANRLTNAMLDVKKNPGLEAKFNTKVGLAMVKAQNDARASGKTFVPPSIGMLDDKTGRFK